MFRGIARAPGVESSPPDLSTHARRLSTRFSRSTGLSRDPTHHDQNLYQVLSDWGNPNHAALHGVAPRAIQALFDSVRVGGDSGTRVTCSYVEVYNDSVNDLLGARKGVPLREAAQGVIVDGLAVEEVASLRQTMALVGRGNALRVVAGMKMNARSSRGHAVLTVRLETRCAGVDSAGSLVLVDLAGMASATRSEHLDPHPITHLNP